MADESQLEILDRGVAAWNEWRRTVVDCINLSGADFSMVNLGGADLSAADLLGANLSGADLSHCDFGSACFGETPGSRMST